MTHSLINIAFYGISAFLLVAQLISLVAIYYGLKYFVLAHCSSFWSQVEGQLTDLEIQTSSTRSSYRPTIVPHYTYQIGEKIYNGRTLGFHMSGAGISSATLKVGSSVPVYYSSTFPSLSTLEPGPSFANYITLLCFAVAAAAPAMIFYNIYGLWKIMA